MKRNPFRQFQGWIASVALVIMLLGSMARAEEFPSPDLSDPGTAGDARPVDSSPILSSNAIWAGSLLIVVIAIFLAAAVVGPFVRSELPTEVPDAFSHHEDPAHHEVT